jgi:hypothetical protein
MGPGFHPLNIHDIPLFKITPNLKIDSAIVALNKAVEADGENLDALLALGVSLTNEMERVSALNHLKSWITKSPKYSALSHDAQPTFSLQDQVHPPHPQPQAPPYTNQSPPLPPPPPPKVLTLYLAAARANPHDPEVHTVLGVLYNLSREYPKAVDAFRRALDLNPSDYSLWNKLGATLANDAAPADAIDAYLRALEIKGNYVRAIANLGIAYSNLVCRRGGGGGGVDGVGDVRGVGAVLSARDFAQPRGDAFVAVRAHGAGAPPPRRPARPLRPQRPKRISPAFRLLTPRLCRV